MIAKPLFYYTEYALGVALLLGLGLGGAAAAADKVAEIVRQAEPGVVSISGYMDPTGGEPYARASGVLLHRGGLVVSVSNLFTDARSRRMCERFQVRLADGAVRQAKALSVDAMLNLLVLELMGPGDYPVADVGSGVVRPGDEVIALAGGPAAHYALGEVKARHKRSIYGAGLGDMLIDSHIELPEHAFGGPLLDDQGRVVGIITPNVHRPPDQPATPGEVHALPVRVAQGFLRMAGAFPNVRQNWLGLAFRPLFSDERKAVAKVLGRQAGVRVEFVWPQGPADGERIRPGDVLVSLNGEFLSHLHELDRKLMALTPGDSAELALLRDARVKLKRVEVERRPPWAGYVAWRVPQVSNARAR